MTRFCFSLCTLITLQHALVSALPTMNIAGFSWAENLIFDNKGEALFVSENTRGELHRITLCNSGAEYCNAIHLSNNTKKFGGLSQSEDGNTIYAGVTFKDSSFGIITTTSAVNSHGTYEIYLSTKYQPNGMQIDWKNGYIYYTDTGSNSLMVVDMKTKTETLLKTIEGANGVWLDTTGNKLYVGELTSKKVNLFDTSAAGVAVFQNQYAGFSSESITHMLDDLTLYSTTTSTISNTVILGADYQGHQIKKFTLDGSSIAVIKVPADLGALSEITSVRWGRAPNFDAKSIYVTEGGGLTSKVTNRRVFQVSMAGQ